MTGLLRYNGRSELAAIEALEGHVIDPSQTQSTTAVLDKISGAALIGARQQQARIAVSGRHRRAAARRHEARPRH